MDGLGTPGAGSTQPKEYIMRYTISIALGSLLASGTWSPELLQVYAMLTWVLSILLLLACFSETSMSAAAGAWLKMSAAERLFSHLWLPTMAVLTALSGMPILAGVMLIAKVASFAMIQHHLKKWGEA